MKCITTLLFTFSTLCFSQNFWEKTNGPYGFEGIVNSIAFNQNGNIVIGCTSNSYEGYIFLSTDNGDNFTQIFNSSSFIYSVAINSRGDILAGDDHSRVWRSSDNGNNWNYSTLNLPGVNCITALVINSNGHIFAGTSNDGIFRSTDNGENWIQILNGLPDLDVLSLAINSSGYIFAGFDYDGLYRSTDNGENWMYMDGGGRTVNTIAINKDNHIFYGTDLDGIVRSTDNGVSWTQIFTGLPSICYFFSSLAIDSNNHIFASTSDPYRTEGGIFRSTNNGESWTKLNNGLKTNLIHSLAINSNGQLFAGSSNYGIFRSYDNGENWTQRLEVGSVYSLAINTSDHIFAGTCNGCLRSTDNGINWIQLDLGSESICNALAINSSGHIFAGTSSLIIRSTDNGETWTHLNNEVKAYCLTVNSKGYIFAGTRDEGIYRSTDNGSYFIKKNNGLTSTYVSAVTISKSDYVFLGTDLGIFRSTDDGETWIQSTSVLEDVLSLAVNTKGHIFAATFTHNIYRSTDDGETWTLLKEGYQERYTYSTSLAINVSDHIFLGYDNHVFQSLDNGDTWVEINNSSTISEFYSLAINSKGFLFAGTFGGGVLKSINSTTNSVGIKNNIIIPSAYSLTQNYPNPFNPSTNINFSIPKTSFVMLKIYDVLGREVITLVNEEKFAGNYEIKFDGSNLCSGIYFYRMQAGSFIETKKLIIQK